ncbi:MAG TPA: hypothetical protein VIY49_24280 [Bryobacteraceae bacterium]
MTRRLSILTLIPACLWSQAPGPQTGLKEMPPGVFRGALLSRQGGDQAGDLTLRARRAGAHTDEDTDLVCHYDAHTYISRDHYRIAVSSLNVGEPLEILANRKPGSPACYASMVQVIDPEQERAAERAAADARQFKTQNPDARVFFFTPRGDRTLAGVVVGLTARALTLRTRAGEAILALRPDTRYWDDGLGATRADLRVNTHVFVRAGQSLDGVVEAYQVMWGQILDVSSSPSQQAERTPSHF